MDLSPLPDHTGAASREPQSVATEQVVVALGSGLVGAVGLLETSSVVPGGSLGMPFALGVLATVLLIAASGAGYLLIREPGRRSVVALPGAIGAVTAGALLLIAARADTASQWLAGPLVIVVAAVGLRLFRAVPYVVAGAIGLSVFATRCFVQFNGDRVGEHLALWVSLAIWIFVAVVTAGAWFLPGRHAVSIWIGAAGLALDLVAVPVVQLATELTGGFDDGHRSFGTPTLDITINLVLVALAVAGWALLHRLSGVAGYRVLILGASMVAPASAAGVLAPNHPAWCQVVLMLLGVGLLGLVLTGRLRRGPGEPATDVAPPPGV